MTIQIRIAAPRRDHLIKAVLAATLLAAPAAFAQPTEQPAAPADGHEYTVTMGNMEFGASPSGLKVGDTIVWVNHDTVMHSVTARDHSFDVRLNPGQSAKLALTKAGRVPFYCLFHPTMRGTLDVAAK